MLEKNTHIKNHSLVSTVIAFILTSLRIQLYIFIVSMPIIAAWGMPLSLACFWGNILCAPFITLFLTCSLLWTLCYYLSLPLDLITWCLESITYCWSALLNYGLPYTWSVVLPPMPSILSISILCIVAGVMWGRKQEAYTLKGEITLLSIIALLLVGLRTGWAYPLPCMIPYGTKEMVLLHSEGDGVYLIDDQGAIKNNASLKSWMRYNLGAALAKTIPQGHIEYIVLTQPTQARLTSALCLVQAGYARALLIPIRSLNTTLRQWWSKQQQPVPLIFASHARIDRLKRMASCARFDKLKKGCNTKTDSQV